MLRAENLGNIAPHRWMGNKSNPYAKLELVGVSGTSNQSIEVGKTEVIHGNLSPEWTEIFIIDHSESDNWTQLKVSIFDCRRSVKDEGSHAGGATAMATSIRVLPSFVGSSRHDPVMGEANIEVGDILEMEGQQQECELDQGGSLFVRVTESVEGEDEGEFECQVRGLDVKNIEAGWLGLGAVDPYFEMSKKYLVGGMPKWDVVYRSEHMPNIVNPYWRPFKLNLEKLCNCNLRKELKITLWDYESKRKPRLIGELPVSIDILRENVTIGGNANRERALSFRDKVGDADEEEVGLLVVIKADITV